MMSPSSNSAGRPSYEGRGLKSDDADDESARYGRPSYEGRGLKFELGVVVHVDVRRPSYEGRGLKSHTYATSRRESQVAPRMRGVD